MIGVTLGRIAAQCAMALIGLVHAAAAYFYFSKDRRAWRWTLAWLACTAFCILALRYLPWLAVTLFAAALAAWTWWWRSIRPSLTHQWVSENARQATARVIDEVLVVQDFRNFEWLSGRECVPRWEVRRFPLAELSAVDLFVSTWGDPRVAHLIVSFVFGEREPLAFSIETRRESSERWSMLAGFMRSYELILIAADERDVIRVRSNRRGEDVRRYRLETTPQMRRSLLEHYVQEMNELAQRPRFYNTLFRNCTTEVVRILRAAGRPVPANWEIIASGLVPMYLHHLGLLEDKRPFAAVHAAADIGPAARAAEDDPAFWKRIREARPVAPEPIHAVATPAAPP
ncbi:MAG TPA: DUF4105 domain-containing protein [Gammaproteobacteria bacterium]|mgnify:CR=1 FL=1|nr:DUF4105 domain-containing protein [Gammaproteobacteria bacterium]